MMRTILELTAKVVSAHVANNRVASDDVPRFLKEVHAALVELSEIDSGPTKASHMAHAESASLDASRPQETQSNSLSGDINLSSGVILSKRVDQNDLEKPLIPAVPIEDSIQPERIVCLEDGIEVILLTRYLRTKFKMTPDQYRARWNLPKNYPMAAPNYSERKRAFALAGGFGTTVRPSRQKRRTKVASQV